MFTGIVTGKGRVRSIDTNDFGARLVIVPGAWPHTPAAGDSVAVNGVCLTHAPGGGGAAGALAFDVIRETLARTNLGDLDAGSAVNLEASLTADTPIAGHFVQGHVDAVGRVDAVDAGTEQWRMTVEVDADVMPYVVPKGSIAIDGVSLTIATVDTAASRFEVALIPTTLDLTTLGEASVGDTVNLETDMIARTVVHYLQLQAAGGSTLSLDKLRSAGFTD